jgi:hypothetical protein
MSNEKSKILKTQTDNLISNLRGEVGDLIISWKLLINIKRNVRNLYTENFENDQNNPDIAFLEILKSKFEDDIVARLSELAEQKIGRLTYYFAQRKLEGMVDLSQDVKEYKKFVDKENFNCKRNQFISHKQIPESWTEYNEIYIPIETIGKCLSLAVKLMVSIDKAFLGPYAIFLWHETLKKKTPPIRPLNANYMLLPYMRLDKTTRGIIIKKELSAGLPIFELVKTRVNGIEKDVIVCKKWGAILLDNNTILLCDDYPLINLNEIKFSRR